VNEIDSEREKESEFNILCVLLSDEEYVKLDVDDRDEDIDDNEGDRVNELLCVGKLEEENEAEDDELRVADRVGDEATVQEDERV
jgi:hypothetical protein